MQGLLRVLVWIAVIFGAICGIAYLAFFDVWTVPSDDAKMSDSALPNVMAGDVLLVARHGEISDGYLARCVDPQEPRRFVVGRVGGMDGEVIDVIDQRITLDKKGVSVPSGCGRFTFTNPVTQKDQELVCSIEDSGGREHQVLVAPELKEGQTGHAAIERGKVYLVSDNRHFSMDSRDYGTIPSGNCQHIVFRLYGAKGWFDSKRRNTLLW